MRMLGLKTCDTCRKALRALAADGHEITLRDVRQEPLSPDEIARFEGRFGEALVNRKSTTWRALSDEERARPATELLADHPALMKRPVITDGDRMTLGWTGDVREVWLG
ncbi:arsenate reductase [Brevirhabdus pacifica]|uniref:Arsenate reductase n=1 Tax=Brevirhabdus pacifica TaxID=1267768 RepID=A0A1U7DGB3_9RHOB|nr:ArsC/Spx/MgsR family protein [Brevirhabdus pacifica]APX88933.1 arsenate reductase [Brevirhabdus pacifica]OWU80160.1 arsenate reductase [Loktanella sp. 22II-4b]PJJ86516.1 Spx/MgsR family transcriptional regulator [Brevirhabdus pacifica]